MLRNSLFRERSLIRNAQPDPPDDLLRVTAPHEWLLLGCFAVALFAAALWGVLGRVEQTVAADGALVQPGVRHAVVSVASGVVTEVAAEVGDRVEAGQVIARLELPELRWRLRVSRARVALLEEWAMDPENRPGSGLVGALTDARVELLGLSALDEAGAVIISPRAGEITANSLVEGKAVDAGETVAEVRSGERRAPEVFLFVAPEWGRRIDGEMRARITVTDRFGPRVLAGEVVEVSARPEGLPSWLARIGLVPSAATDYLVRVTVFGADDAQIPYDVPCRVEIVLAQHAPFVLLMSSAGRPR